MVCLFEMAWVAFYVGIPNIEWAKLEAQRQYEEAIADYAESMAAMLPPGTPPGMLGMNATNATLADGIADAMEAEIRAQAEAVWAEHKEAVGEGCTNILMCVCPRSACPQHLTAPRPSICAIGMSMATVVSMVWVMVMMVFGKVRCFALCALRAPQRAHRPAPPRLAPARRR